MEDLRDSWIAPNNQRECKELLNMLFNFQKSSPQCQISILSGDAHVGTIGEIESNQPQHLSTDGHSALLRQIVSSGIGSPPPQGLAGFVLKMAAAEKLTLAAPDFQGSLLELEGQDSCILSRRNFATITEEETGLLVTFFAEEGDTVRKLQHRWSVR